MEVGLQLRRPLGCRAVFHERGFFKFKPVLGSLAFVNTVQSLQFLSWRTDCSAGGVSHKIFASSGFSSKRRRRFSPRPKLSAPEGFMPKAPGGMSTQKRDQKNNDDKKGSSMPVSSSTKKTTERKVAIEKEPVIDLPKNRQIEEGNVDGTVNKIKEIPGMSKNLRVSNNSQLAGNGSVGDDATTLQKKETTFEADIENVKVDSAIEGKHLNSDKSLAFVIDESFDSDAKVSDDASQKSKMEMQAKVESVFKGKHLTPDKSSDFVKDADIESDMKVSDDASLKSKMEREAELKMAMEAKLRMEMETKLKMEMEAKLKKEMEAKLKLEMEAKLRKQEIEKLAQENFLRGTKMFVYPQVVKPDEDIEVFLNRGLSTLNDEPDVLIMGAFNDWRWKSFTARLNKTQLQGDWWSCQLHVPKESYKMDFVFFNGQNKYDNNDQKDFCITVEQGMDVFAFEDFLLEEKRREQEKLAAEKAERERQEEERRRIEAEKAADEADKEQAKKETERKREMLHQFMKKAARSVDNVWYIEPSEFKGGDLVRLYYHKSSGPLSHAEELWLHGGYNNWKDGLSIVSRLVSSEKTGSDWWYAEVTVPGRALVLDWVFADGPPQNANAYDNNGRLDFHAIVPKTVSEELYWAEEEHQTYRKLQEERRKREEAIRAKAEKTARMKAETKERTLKRFLLSQKHIVYTDPLDVKAGGMVTVFYNPANTVLNGKSEVWFRCSFNRWTHRMGPLPPQQMLPVENSSHVKTTVKVPLDAYMMDFVFSERQEGGIFDNKNGMDYHIPVSGSVAKEPPMHIVHVAVEMAPIAKVGGLGDVVTSLSRAVQDLNHNVDIILPKYNCLKYDNVKDLESQRSYHWGGTEIKVWAGKVEGLSVYFLEPQNGLFWKGCIYGCNNDGERFGFFCHAALEFLLQSGFHPDILHCHDWSSAPVSWLFKDYYMQYGLSKTRVVFTIHNLEFGAQLIGKAMAYSHKATTVSPTYSKEVAGHPAIAPHLYKFHGIINGIDQDIWDPFNDKLIPVSYTSENVDEGKRAAKEALQQRVGLKKAELPLVGIISRLTRQKGIHLIKHAIWRTIERNGQVVLLGSAPDPDIQNDFVNLANQLHSGHGDRARLCLTYDEPLSHLIYAGADFMLVPSIFEPCGLTQLTAMRYGSIPVVRKTGGLYDSVFDVDHDKERAAAQGLEPNGFNFDGADTAGVDYALNRAISAWYDGRDWFNSLRKKVMEQDWSWNRPALDYVELYHAARKY
ncbi:starch synthase 3, chloroplastic/amyloplastic-like [Mangifera indica]|uniref:starch synthase 3, chloroplastic/amyloplastic-like n=1 Tax=Mangifera indica TaxID=29780 RepID=UPI001CFAE0CD|nr:starch synthase 3, chloroplastic/amyloplastic-like [Mangifera indica]